MTGPATPGPVEEVRHGSIGDSDGLAAGGPTPSVGRRSNRNVAADVLYRFGLVIVWFAIIAVFGALRPDTFLTTANFGAMFGSQAGPVVLALALVVSLYVGEFDLSVAAILGLSATIVATLNGLYGWNIWVAMAIALLVSVAVGAINGLLIVYLGIDGIVATLGMGTFLTGIAIWLSQQQAIGGVSLKLQSALNQKIAGLSSSFWIAIGIAVVIWYVLRRTPTGRYLLFIGQNREVARLVGLNVNRLRFLSLVATGLVSGAAGILVVGAAGGFLASSSAPLLLPAFAAAFLGASTILPGQFNVWGTVIAILFLTTGITGLQLLNLAGSSWVTQLFYGGALVVAVSITAVVSRRRSQHVRV